MHWGTGKFLRYKNCFTLKVVPNVLEDTVPTVTVPYLPNCQPTRLVWYLHKNIGTYSYYLINMNDYTHRVKSARFCKNFFPGDHPRAKDESGPDQVSGEWHLQVIHKSDTSLLLYCYFAGFYSSSLIQKVGITVSFGLTATYIISKRTKTLISILRIHVRY